jgi:hypothetical protein
MDSVVTTPSMEGPARCVTVASNCRPETFCVTATWSQPAGTAVFGSGWGEFTAPTMIAPVPIPPTIVNCESRGARTG